MRSDTRSPVEIIDRVGFAITLLAAAGIPLLVSWDDFDGYIVPKLVAARVVTLALLTLWSARAGLAGAIRVVRTPIDVPLLAFLASAAVSTVLALNRNVALFGTYQRYEGALTLATYAVLFWTARQFLRSERQGQALLRAMLVGGYVAAVVAIVQSVFGTLLARAPVAVDNAFFFGGHARAYGTLGNPNALGVYAAMLLPLAVGELRAARSLGVRLLSANAAVVFTLALLLTFSRSGAIGAAFGAAAAVGLSWPGDRRRRRLIAAAGVTVLVIAALAALGGGLSSALLSRALSIFTGGGSASTRLHVWRDLPAMIAARPWFGWGPDNFPLAYPPFETGDWTPGVRIDRAHSDLLQVLTAQGLVGAAAYVWIVAALVVALMRALRAGARSAPMLLGALLAYEVALQFNFSWLPSSIPFWLMLAGGLAAVGAGAEAVVTVPNGLRIGAWAAAMVMLAMTVDGLPRPFFADRLFLSAILVDAQGNRAGARALAEQAAGLAPDQSQYEILVGDLAFDADARGNAGPGADWEAAERAYQRAADLGSFSPGTYRNLARGAAHLGHHEVAVRAARRAVELDRFDGQNQALLDSLVGGSETAPSG